MIILFKKDDGVFCMFVEDKNNDEMQTVLYDVLTGRNLIFLS